MHQPAGFRQSPHQYSTSGSYQRHLPHSSSNLSVSSHGSPAQQQQAPPPPPPPPTFHYSKHHHHQQQQPQQLLSTSGHQAQLQGTADSLSTVVIPQTSSTSSASAAMTNTSRIAGQGESTNMSYYGGQSAQVTPAAPHLTITVGGTQLDDLRLPHGGQSSWQQHNHSTYTAPTDAHNTYQSRHSGPHHHGHAYHPGAVSGATQQPVVATRFMKGRSPASSSSMSSADPMLYEARVGGEVLGEPVQTLTTAFDSEQFGNIAQLTAALAPRVPSATVRHYDLAGESSFSLRDFWYALDAPFSAPVALARPAHLSPHKLPENTLFYSPVLSSFSITLHSEASLSSMEQESGVRHDELSDKASSRSETGSQLSKSGGRRLKASKVASARGQQRVLRKQALSDEREKKVLEDPPPHHLSAEMLTASGSACGGLGEGAHAPLAATATTSSSLTPPSPPLTMLWSSSERPENRPPLIDHIKLLADDGFTALLEANNTDVTYSSWVCVLWQPVFCHGHTPQQSCGSFLAYYLLRPPRHLFRSGVGPVSVMNACSDSPVFRCETNLIGIDLWRSQIATPTPPPVSGSLTLASPTLTRRVAAEGLSQPSVHTEHCTVPICAILPNRLRSDVWYEPISHSTVQRKVPLFLFLTALQVASAAAEPFQQAQAANDLSNADACSIVSASSASGSPNLVAESTRNSHVLTDHLHTLRAERWLNDLASLYLHA